MVIASTRPRSRSGRRRARRTSSPPSSGPSLARRTGTRSPDLVGLLGEEAAALRNISRSVRSVRFSRRRRVSSARSSLVRPSAAPASASAWMTQRRQDSLAMPRSCATWRIDWPGCRARRTASARNSGGYGGLPRGMWTPILGARYPDCQVSTKADQLHFMIWFAGSLYCVLTWGQPWDRLPAATVVAVSNARPRHCWTRSLCASRLRHPQCGTRSASATTLDGVEYRVDQSRAGPHAPSPAPRWPCDSGGLRRRLEAKECAWSYSASSIAPSTHPWRLPSTDAPTASRLPSTDAPTASRLPEWTREG